jgi:hypothetical protein
MECALGLAAGKSCAGKGSSCAYWGNGEANGEVYGEAYGEAKGEVVGELRVVDWDLVELELLLVVVDFRDVLGLTMAS